ncbi:hypothetical protein CUJ84_Chr000190 [Rhizobium leguminosarum]|uniref:Uncharacterized protein n=1 Tax=Rhizobium leguminosarum TaxID=384 RepID=A0A2K9YX99_RHILE|nr:hypothetical protein CUJ84_Chr000190 [Rhizobium leguminosarum]
MALMAAPHPNLAGVEPLVSTRPADPRKNGATGRALRKVGGERRGRDPWLDPGWCRQADEGQASAIPQEPGVEDVSGTWR